ncbi:MAG: DUF2141 domain-containing protein [Polaribacter sp.]|nr:DUF2141 domain-containing protein [Polaribacter sp.]MDG1810474.1 DUF2141 domain-containing protein [Polaribacter sp.]MDG1994806.1 DUF2141 domain-containing protein [Polaribacter sp.]
MKIFATIFALAIVFQTSLLTVKEVDSEKRDIIVTVPNVGGNEGKVHFALYDKDNFMSIPIQTQSDVPNENESTVTFTNIAPGNYAIVCFHDANSNDEMDFQENGMPLESYGASNNSMSFGPPNFENSKFEVSDKDVTLEIRF